MSEIIECIKEYHIHYLVIGTIFSVFSIGRYNILISIYIWPFCYLSFLHKNTNKLFPLIAVSLCLVFSNIIRWIGATNLNVGLDFIIGIYFSIINIIPFIIDDIFYNKIAKWKNVLVFPLSVAICEFLFSFNVFANFNIYAYAHRENIQYLQIVSLFGCYFLSFVISLFSSILEYSIYIFSTEDQKITKFIFFYVIIILFIYFFGFIRLLIPEKEGTYNIASSLGKSQYLYENGENISLPIEDYIEYINDTMYKASSIKAEIMMFAEEAFYVEDEDIIEIIKQVQNLAKEYKIFVLLPLDAFYSEETKSINEAILISDEGKVLYEYQKQHLIPLIEKDYSKNMSDVKVIDTKLGKLTVAICYDINYPYFLNSLSRDHFDLLLVPSWDWDGIAEFHSNEAKFRAIEGGFNIIKNTANGIVISHDYKGRILSYYIGKNFGDYFLISTVNKEGVKTLYSYIGFLFNYLYIISLLCILISGKIYDCFNKKETKRENSYKLRDFNIDDEDD